MVDRGSQLSIGTAVGITRKKEKKKATLKLIPLPATFWSLRVHHSSTNFDFQERVS